MQGCAKPKGVAGGPGGGGGERRNNWGFYEGVELGGSRGVDITRMGSGFFYA